jgi:hypothetical protein
MKDIPVFSSGQLCRLLVLRTFTLAFCSCLLVLCSCRANKGDNPDPGKVLNQAEEDVKAGKYENALHEQIWFHEHALEKDRSCYGVRLSFALAKWVELGKKYPKALVELKKIRDRDAALVASGKGSINQFVDVKAINGYLGESAATVALFKQLDHNQPQLPASVYYVEEEPLVNAGEFQLARKYLDDPEKSFATARKNYESGLRFSNNQSTMKEESRRATEDIFTDNVVRLITLLDKTGGHDEAVRIQAQALELFDNKAIRSAIIKSSSN